MPKKYLFVPQGCYIEISPSTTSEFIGLLTDNMSRCYPVVVVKAGHVFLCHADSYTDIADKEFGSPAWVKAAISSSGKGVVEIYLGSLYSDAPNPKTDEIVKILNQWGFAGKYIIHIKESCWQIAVDRKMGTIVDEIDRIEYLATDQASYCQSFTNCCVIGCYDNPRPPIRIFDPSSSQFLLASQIITQHGGWFEVAVKKYKKKEEYHDLDNTYIAEALHYLEEKSKDKPEIDATKRNKIIFELLLKYMRQVQQQPPPSFSLLAEGTVKKLDMLVSGEACSLSTYTKRTRVKEKIACKYFLKYVFDEKAEHDPFQQEILEQLKLLGAKEVDFSCSANFLRDIVGSYLFVLFKFFSDQQQQPVINLIIENGLIEHLEILAIAKMLEVNFILLHNNCEDYVEPKVICNSWDKRRTICLLYVICGDKRQYYVMAKSPEKIPSCLLDRVPDKSSEVIFYLPAAAKGWTLLPSMKAYYEQVVVSATADNDYENRRDISPQLQPIQYTTTYAGVGKSLRNSQIVITKGDGTGKKVDSGVVQQDKSQHQSRSHNRKGHHKSHLSSSSEHPTSSAVTTTVITATTTAADINRGANPPARSISKH